MRHLFIFFICLFSSPAFSQWESLGSGLGNTDYEIYCLDVVDENIIWGVPYLFPGHAPEYTHTIDGGETWITGALPPMEGDFFPINIQAIDANTAWILMVAIITQDSCRIFKTTDGGDSWTEQFGGFNEAGHALATMHFFNENDGLLYGSPGTALPITDSLQMYTTSNGGDTWTRVDPTTLPEPLDGEGNWINTGNGSYEALGDTFWGTTRAHRIFKSTDKGYTWDAYNVPTTAALRGVAFQDDLTGMVVGKSPNYIGKTTDGGETWTDITASAPLAYLAIEYVPGTENTYVITDGTAGSSKMFITRNGGETWVVEDHSPTMTSVVFLSETLGFGGGNVESATDGGIFKWTGNLAGTAGIQLDDKAAFSIFPNPAQDQLFIQPAAIENIKTITIYTLYGQQLMQQDYYSDLAISIENLSAGMYLLELTTTDQHTHIQHFTKN